MHRGRQRFGVVALVIGSSVVAVCQDDDTTFADPAAEATSADAGTTPPA